MKRNIIIIACLMALSTAASATGLDTLLGTIEQNNTTLKALRQTVDAEKIGNRTDITLPDPEVEFNYLWGSPAGTGDRKDISVRQTFDLATVAGMKSRAARVKNDMAERQYEAQRMQIMLEAKTVVLDIIYYNALIKELTLRTRNAAALADSQKRRLESGDGNILDHNNARLSLSKAEAELQQAVAERDVMLTSLAALNGGEAVTVSDDAYTPVALPADFNAWYATVEAKAPLLAYAKSDIELANRQLAVDKAGALPTLTVGYMSEKTVGEHFQGITAGITLPLWSNRNKVRQAKAAIEAAKTRSTDTERLLRSKAATLYRQAAALATTATAYRQAVSECSNSDLLKKALDAGEISITEYYLQSSLYYDNIDRALAAERDYQKAYAQLTACEL